MYKINLLPEKYLENKRSQTLKNRLIYSLVIVLAVLLIVYNIMISFANSQYTQYMNLIGENSQLQALADSLSEYDNTKTVKETIADTLRGTEQDILPLLIHITNSSTSDITITELVISENEQVTTCVIAGNALKNDSISKWINEISKLEGIGEVQSSFIQLNEDSETEQYDFELLIPIL